VVTISVYSRAWRDSCRWKYRQCRSVQSIIGATQKRQGEGDKGVRLAAKNNNKRGVLASGPPEGRTPQRKNYATRPTPRPRAGVARAELGQAPPAAEDRDEGGVGALQALRERIDFLRGFVAHPEQVGSVIPSSHVLEQRLVRSAQLSRARCVVELGPGTGGTTRAFLRAMPAAAHLMAIELNEGFAARLRSSIRDPR